MADFTNTQKSGSMGWIIGAVVVVLVILYIVFAGTSDPGTGTTVVLPDGTPTVEPATSAVPLPAVPATD